MCYNKKCTIEIKSCIGGETNTVYAKGRVLKTESDISFDYVLDGDKCTLTYKDNKAVQSRRGKQNITMTFQKGENSECILESGGFSGAFTVFTHDLQFEECGINAGKKNVPVYILLIVYTLGEDKIELTFSAKI